MTPLAIWDSQNHCETLEGCHKCHLWHYQHLDPDCGWGIAWSSVCHCESMPQSKENILPVSAPSATPFDSSHAAYSVFDPSYGDYFQLHLATCFPAQKSHDVLSELQQHQKSLSNEDAATFSVGWLPLSILELCTWECTIMMTLGISFILPTLFFNIFIHSSIFFVHVTVLVMQKQRNKESMPPIKSSPSLHPYLNRISLKHFVPQG